MQVDAPVGALAATAVDTDVRNGRGCSKQRNTTIRTNASTSTTSTTHVSNTGTARYPGGIFGQFSHPRQALGLAVVATAGHTQHTCRPLQARGEGVLQNRRISVTQLGAERAHHAVAVVGVGRAGGGRASAALHGARGDAVVLVGGGGDQRAGEGKIGQILLGQEGFATVDENNVRDNE